MAMIGMDVAEVQGLAQQLGSCAQEITGIIQQLTSRLGSTTWVGNDRNRFESDWQSQHVPNLRRVVDALDQAGQIATLNAQQQEQASNS